MTRMIILILIIIIIITIIIIVIIIMLCTEFIKPGANTESRRFRTGQKNILLFCPKTPRLHARSRLYEFGVYLRKKLNLKLW